MKLIHIVGRVYVLALLIPAALLAQPGGLEKKAPNPKVVRVTEPQARSAVEVAVAIDPTNPDHIVGVSIQEGIKDKEPTSNYAYNSTDGGRTWKTVAQSNPGKRIQGDDAIAFTADGLAIRAYLAFDGFFEPRPKRAFSGVWTSTSRDGLAWSDPVIVVDHINSPLPHEDKPWLRADNSKDSPNKGNVYIAWTRFDKYGSKDPDHKSHIYFSRSTDNAKSFAVPHRISEVAGDCLDGSQTVMGAIPAIGPKGEVYVVWGGPLGLVMAKSDDGGVKFGKNQVIGDTPGGWSFSVDGLGRSNGLPVVAADVSTGKHRGSLYVNWIDQRNGDPDVFLVASRDGGATWSKPLRVNDDPKGNGKDQFFTWMAVDPVDGSVNIAFYDRRDTDGIKTGVTLARSTDGGRSFVNYKINQEPFAGDPKTFFGDYLGVDAYGGRVVVLYHHFVEAKKCAISSAVYDFAPGSQEARVEKKP